MDPESLKARITPAGAFHMQPVDIIIPFHGEYDKVSRLMESIFNTVRTNRYQITLVDDASPNEKFIVPLKKIPGVVAIRQEKQKGFGAAVNTAIKNTKQPHVVILQSDVVVDGNTWLSSMGETLLTLKDRGIKMVSPLTDNPMTDDDRLAGAKRQFRPDVILGDGYLPMYCCLCHRDLFKYVGPLAEFPYAGGEAEDYAYRMRRLGFKQAVCGSSWVHHDGRATLAQYDSKPKVKELLEQVLRKVQQQEPQRM